MFAKLLSATILALAVNSAVGQINPADGVVLNDASNSANGDYSGVGGVNSESTGVGGLVWGIGSRQLGGGSAFGRNLRADGTDTHVSGQGVWALRDNGGGNGWANISSGMQGWVTGHQSNDRGIQGARAYAIGSFAHTGDEGRGIGDAQRIELMLRTITTDAAPKQLSSSAYNTVAAISPNATVLTVPDNGTLRVKGAVVAREPATGASRSWEVTALIKRGAGAGTTTLVGSSVTPEFGDSAAAWSFAVAADPANGSLALIATGQTGKTIQWVARVISIENVGGTGLPPPPPPPPPALVVATASLPVATVNVAYAAPLSATGGVAPYTWAASGLPTGLSVSGASIVGTPTTAAVVSVILTVTDAVGATASKSLLITVGGVPPPPPTGSNVALASAGAAAIASSTYNDLYPVFAVNDGDRIGRSWGQGGTGSGWADGTVGVYPDWVQINFSGMKTVNRVVVYTLQDSSSPVEPTDSMTFTNKGVIDFTVQGWNGAAWVVLGTVTGNNLVKRTVTFAAYTTNKIRVNVTAASPNASFPSYSRIVEIEAWGTN